MKPIALNDFLDFSFLSAAALSPDGRYAAFMRHNCDAENDGYLSQLWVSEVAGGQNVPLTGDGKKRVFCWEDETHILHGTPSEDHTDFYRTDAAGQESGAAFSVPLRAESIERIDDARYLLSARVRIAPAHPNPDCVVIDELPTSMNGIGFIAGTRTALFIFDSRSETLEKITPELFSFYCFALCREQGKIVFSGHEHTDFKVIREEIRLYDLTGGTTETLLEKGAYRIMHVDMLGDKVLFVGTLGLRSGIGENGYVYLLDPVSKAIAEYAKPDYEITGIGVGSDCRYGGGTVCKVDGGRIFFCAADYGAAPLFEVAADKSLLRHGFEEGSVDSFDVTGEVAVCVGMKGVGLQELYAIDLKTGAHRQLTHWNDEYTATHRTAKPVACFCPSRHGGTISGWVLLPAHYEPGKRYPGILDIHGGPKASFGTVYFHEMQLWAGIGYFVFFCNPHGSDGQGDAYSKLTGNFGTIDYDDIMDFTDHVLKSFPALDPGRLGVTGGSYGGFMTNWIVGHTDRFAAAATQRSIGDWIVHEYACDTGYWITSEAYPPNAIANVERAWHHSPGKYAHNITTPLLFIHSDQDLRCLLSEAAQVYAGAARHGAVVRMCLFHDENHELSRSGRPINRVKRLAEITNWMEKYLKGGSAV